MRPRPRRELDSGRQRFVSTVLCVSCSFGSAKRLNALPVLHACVVFLYRRRVSVPENLLLQPLTAASREIQMPWRVLECLFLCVLCDLSSGKRNLKSWPDQRHELQMSHMKSKLPLQGMHETHGTQSKTLV